MPPIVAFALTLGFIVFLFRRDFRERPNVTSALWLPCLWLFLILSRYVSEWIAIFGVDVGGGSLEEGSPLDACFYFVLIASGIYVLNKRQVRLSEIVLNNRWLTIFFIYCFLAILWSDFPFVAFKRWIKILGHPIMVLILFTEPSPKEAVVRLMKRCAYVVIPVSILFIKYYPQWGRGFSEWTGQAFNTGITSNKNALGFDCLILGFFFVWNWLRTWNTEHTKARRGELILTAVFLGMTWWLLSMAQSETALVSLVIGITMLLFLGSRSVNKRNIGAYLVAGIVIFVIAELAFGLSGHVIEFLGRDATLTDRTKVWHDVLQVPINPLLGAGFESFWLGDRLKIMWAKWLWRPNQAHNGYLETYLNLGLIGLCLLIGLILVTYRKARLALLTDFQFGRFRLAFLAAVVACNWTEATFKALHPIWFVFYIISLDYPNKNWKEVEPPSETLLNENDAELAYESGGDVPDLVDSQP